MTKHDISVLLVNTPLSAPSLDSKVEREYWTLHNHVRMVKHFGPLSDNAKLHFGNTLVVNRGLLLIAQALLYDGVNVEYSHGFDVDFNGFDIIGVSSYSTNFDKATEFARKVKYVNAKTILVLGGPHASHEYLHEVRRETNPFDIYVRDVGVTTMKEIVQATMNNYYGLLNTVDGICFKKGSSVVVTPERQRQDDTRYSAVAYDLLPVDYLPVARIFFSVGCLSQCAFCANPKSSIIKYDVGTLGREICFLSNTLGTELVCVGDENFVEGPERTRQKINLMNSIHAGAYWIFQTRVNTALDKSLKGLDTNKCLEVALGVESSDDVVLRLSRKNVNYAHSLITIDKLQNAGLNVLAYFMVGLPGETEQSVRDNFVSMANLVERDVLTEPVIFIPYPGTEIFRNPERFSIEITKDFQFFRRDQTPLYSYTGGLEGTRIRELYLEGLESYLVPAYRRLIKRHGISDSALRNEPFSVAL